MTGSFILTLLIISVIVVVHEFGHFLLAKKNGIGVEEFSVGFGPTLFAFDRGGTHYALKLILFGGACRMTGETVLEDGESPETAPENSFMAKPPWARFSVIAAGPVFNFLLAFVLSLAVIGVAGANPPIVTSMEKGSGAETAGLETGDRIISINGKKMTLGRDIELYLLSHPLTGEPVRLVWEHDGERREAAIDTKTERYLLGINYRPDLDAALSGVTAGSAAEQAGLRAGDLIVRIDGEEITGGQGISDYFDAHTPDGSMIELEYVRDGERYVTQLVPRLQSGASLGFDASYLRVKVGPLGVIRGAFSEVRYWISNTLTSVGMLLRGSLGFNEVSGPVGVVSIVDDVVEESRPDGSLYVILNLLNLTILLSANLGVLNLLPLPALDGGRLVFILIEAVTGHPVPRKAEGIIHAVGIILLFMLMIAVLFKDIVNLF